MDGMYDTSYKLYDKPMQDKVFDKERYIPIAQMSYYLISNIAYYATYEHIEYTKKMFMFMENTELFQRQIDYVVLLDNVYTKIQTNPEVVKAFDNKSPYSIGLLYASILGSYDKIITWKTLSGTYPCEIEEMNLLVEYIKSFYTWIYDQENSSFRNLGEREQKQIISLFESKGLSANSKVAGYICEISFAYINPKNITNYFDGRHLANRSLPIYKNDETFLEAFGTSYYEDFIDLHKLLEEKKSHQIKDK